MLGCGRVIAQKATEQLIAGDAVDRTISQIDFRVLIGKKVYLDTQYVNKTVPGVGFVTSEYIISSLRQKMMCDGLLLEEKADEADFIVEMRIGALGADGHEIIYGMPANNYLNIAASVAPTAPVAAATAPSMPEISFAKKNDQMAAAKIALFAYNRRTREPIWQSGLSQSRSIVADRWFLGAGPYHKGSIYGAKKRAPMEPSMFGSSEEEEELRQDYFVERRFADPTKSLADTPPTPAKPAAPAATPAPTPAVITAAASSPQPAGALPSASTATSTSTTPPASTTPSANATPANATASTSSLPAAGAAAAPATSATTANSTPTSPATTPTAQTAPTTTATSPSTTPAQTTTPSTTTTNAPKPSPKPEHPVSSSLEEPNEIWPNRDARMWMAEFRWTLSCRLS